MNFFSLFSVAAFLLLSLQSIGQNLVPNPGFEMYSACPTTYNQVLNATGWQQSNQNNSGSTHSEFLNSCAGSNSNGFGAPLNVWGNQAPASGQGYMAIASMAPTISSDYRENIYIQLSSNLEIGKTYKISFKASLADNSKNATDKIGLKLSTTPTFLINNQSSLYSSAVVGSQLSWTLLSDTIVADSAYNYVAIGNFFDDANTVIQNVCSSCPYQHIAYYFDDIEVVPLSITSVKYGSGKTNWNLYPNPANTHINITSDKSFNNGIITIRNVLGKAVSTIELSEMAGDPISVDVSTLAQGTYFVTMSNDRRSECIKLIISR